MVHQNLVRVTSFCDLKSPCLKLVTPSLNYTPNAFLKSRYSKLVTLICTPLRKKNFFFIQSCQFFSGILLRNYKIEDFSQIYDLLKTCVSRKLVDTVTELNYPANTRYISETQNQQWSLIIPLRKNSIFRNISLKNLPCNFQIFLKLFNYYVLLKDIL